MAKLSIPRFPFEKIAALKRVHRIVICAGTFLLLGGLFFYFIFMPKTERINELRKNYEDLEGNLSRARAAAKDYDKFQRKYQEAQGEFMLARQHLPDKKEIPSLLESISKSGTRSGLEFLLFQPEKDVSRDFYVEIPVKIQVMGGYHNVAMFFDQVARLPRIVNISNIKIKGVRDSKTAESYLDTSCVATTFRFVERAPETKQTKKKK
jgi:type IV pilus assembly protein PilO